MDQVHRLLQESIFCYRKLMKLYERLREKISTGGSLERLNALLDQSRELNTLVQDVDKQFQKLASDNQVALEDMPLFSEWKTLLNQVKEENKLMRQHLQANMAITSNDIHNLARTKKAISGYRGEKDGRGKQINIFSA
jgi:translation initiation factor 2 alpha subunit (eIF-2alpha)